MKVALFVEGSPDSPASMTPRGPALLRHLLADPDHAADILGHPIARRLAHILPP